jgi:hypothetical protein
MSVFTAPQQLKKQTQTRLAKWIVGMYRVTLLEHQGCMKQCV